MTEDGLNQARPPIAGPVLITGANGFVAGHLAERLLAAGVAVRGLARRPEAAGWLAEQGADIRAGDLLDRGSLSASLAGCQTVVHAAAWTGGAGWRDADAWRTNVDGTANVLAEARAAGVGRLLFISSVAVYGVNRAPIITEEEPTPHVGQLYPDSKIAGEALLQGSEIPHVIVRLACTYGPRGTAWTVRPIEQIRRGELVLLGRDTGLVTPGYIENVVDGLCLALGHPAASGQTFNLADDRSVTYREFYLAYAAMLGRDRLPTLPAIVGRLARLGPAAWLRRILGKPTVGPWSAHFRFNPSRFSIEKAKRMLGYRPAIEFAEGMRRTEAWLRVAGYLG